MLDRRGLDRRGLLLRGAYGAAAGLFAPFARHLAQADAPGPRPLFPQRFVFVVKSSGLQAEHLNPEGLGHGGTELVDAPLAERALPATLSALEPFRARLTILQGLSGRMCTYGHSAFYGALGAFKASGDAPPRAATIDGLLARQHRSVFDHVGLKMGNGSQGTAYPALSALGPNQQLPYQCDPELAYQNLFGSVATGGDIQRNYTRTGNVLDAVAREVRRLERDLPGPEREQLGHYLAGFETLRERRLRLISMQDVLREHAPEVGERYTSELSTHHLEAHFDMAAAALVAGLTQVVSIHCDDLDSSYAGLGITPKVHSVGHGASSGTLTAQDCRDRIRAFHLEQIARLAAQLEATPEGDGSLLDNTLIVYLSDNSDKHHSSATEWPMLVLGNLGGRLRAGGRYLAYPRYGSPHHRHTIGNWWTTVAQAAGVETEHFGQPDFALGRAEDQRGGLAEFSV